MRGGIERHDCLLYKFYATTRLRGEQEWTNHTFISQFSLASPDKKLSGQKACTDSVFRNVTRYSNIISQLATFDLFLPVSYYLIQLLATRPLKRVNKESRFGGEASACFNSNIDQAI